MAGPRLSAPLDRETLGTAYAAALEAYLARPEESTLSGAYELGRQAMHDGLGPLDLVSLHEAALARAPNFFPEGGRPALTRAMAFLLESLLLGAEDVDQAVLERTMSIIVKHRTDLDLVAERVGVKLGDGLFGRQAG